MKKFIVFTILIAAALFVKAQTPQVPSGQPGKLPLPAPKFQPLKPDLKFISSSVISVVEDATRHLFETTISITIKNQGAVATGTGFF